MGSNPVHRRCDRCLHTGRSRAVAFFEKRPRSLEYSGGVWVLMGLHRGCLAHTGSAPAIAGKVMGYLPLNVAIVMIGTAIE